MTETAIAKPFDPAGLAEQLRDKIRVDMATLMPDEMWQELLEKEVKTFFQSREDRQYGGRPKILASVFHGIVIDVLREETRGRVKEMLNSKEWVGFWENSKLTAGEEIKELITKNAPEILSALLANSLQGAVQSMRDNL